MPIEIVIKTVDDIDYLVIDGHLMTGTNRTIKSQEILELLETMGYITIKIEE